MTLTNDNPTFDGFDCLFASQSVGMWGKVFGEPCERPSRSSLMDGLSAARSSSLDNRSSMNELSGSSHAAHSSTSNLSINSSPSTWCFARFVFAFDGGLSSFAHSRAPLRSARASRVLTLVYLCLSNLRRLSVVKYLAQQKFFVGFWSQATCNLRMGAAL